MFTFDQVFGPNSHTNEIYGASARDIVESSLEGINGTIFAYGQTSSGKTYTMQGSSSDPGIISMAIRDIFNRIAESDKNYVVKASYLEIYNENIKDLLSPGNENLKIHEHYTRGVHVAGITEVNILSPSDVSTLMAKGESNRHVGETNMNERSSRSHTILRIYIECRQRGEDSRSVKISCLNLVDLAGSERASHTGAEGLRLKEGGLINKSLLALATVIAKLSENSSNGDSSRGGGGHIPYRDSKITRILQPSLGGNARTLIICTVTPSDRFVEDTTSTLKFASRAKSIKNKPAVNEVISDTTLIKRYRQEIGLLKTELTELRSKFVPADRGHADMAFDPAEDIIIRRQSNVTEGDAAEELNTPTYHMLLEQVKVIRQEMKGMLDTVSSTKLMFSDGMSSLRKLMGQRDKIITAVLDKKTQSLQDAHRNLGLLGSEVSVLKELLEQEKVLREKSEIKATENENSFKEAVLESEKNMAEMRLRLNSVLQEKQRQEDDMNSLQTSLQKTIQEIEHDVNHWKALAHELKQRETEIVQDFQERLNTLHIENSKLTEIVATERQAKTIVLDQVHAANEEILKMANSIAEEKSRAVSVSEDYSMKINELKKEKTELEELVVATNSELKLQEDLQLSTQIKWEKMFADAEAEVENFFGVMLEGLQMPEPVDQAFRSSFQLLKSNLFDEASKGIKDAARLANHMVKERVEEIQQASENSSHELLQTVKDLQNENIKLCQVIDEQKRLYNQSCFDLKTVEQKSESSEQKVVRMYEGLVAGLRLTSQRQDQCLKSLRKCWLYQGPEFDGPLSEFVNSIKGSIDEMVTNVEISVKNSMDKELCVIKRERDDLKEDNSTMKQKMHGLNTNAQAFSKDHLILQRKHDEKEEALLSLKKDHQTLEDRFQSETKKAAKLATQFNELENMYEDLQTKFQDLEEERRQLKLQINTLAKRPVDDHSGCIKERTALAERIEEQRGLLGKLQHEREAFERNSGMVLEEYQMHLQSQQEENHSLTLKHEELIQRVSDLENELEDCQKSESYLMSQLSPVMDVITSSALVGGDSDESQTLLSEIDDRRKEEQKKNVELLVQNKDMFKEISKLKRQVNDTKNQLLLHLGQNDEGAGKVVETQKQIIEQLQADLRAALHQNQGQRQQDSILGQNNYLALEEFAKADSMIEILQFRVKELMLENETLKQQKSSLQLINLQTLDTVGQLSRAQAKSKNDSTSAATITTTTAVPTKSVMTEEEDSTCHASLLDKENFAVPGSTQNKKVGVSSDKVSLSLNSGSQRRRLRPMASKPLAEVKSNGMEGDEGGDTNECKPQ